MARRSLVVDASVAVKWFSAVGEAGVPQAVDILERQIKGEIGVLVPDLLCYEVANALVYKKAISIDKLQLAVENLFSLGLQTVSMDRELMMRCVSLAREFNISVYDACYVAVAQISESPLVTANPRHQNQALGCQVVLLEEWHE